MNVKINIHVSTEKAILGGKTIAGTQAIELTPEFLGKLTEIQKRIVAKESTRFFKNHFPKIDDLPDYSEAAVIARLVELEAAELEAAELEAAEIAEVANLSIEDLVRDYDNSDSSPYWNILNRYPELSERLSELKKYISDRKEISEKEASEKEKILAEKFSREFAAICTPIQTRKWKSDLMSSDEMSDIIKSHVFQNVRLTRFRPTPADRERRVYGLSDGQFLQIESLWALPLTSQGMVECYEHTGNIATDGADEVYPDYIRVVTMTVRVVADWNGWKVSEEFTLPDEA
jgi:hypothetical protein